MISPREKDLSFHIKLKNPFPSLDENFQMSLLSCGGNNNSQKSCKIKRSLLIYLPTTLFLFSKIGIMIRTLTFLILAITFNRTSRKKFCRRKWKLKLFDEVNQTFLKSIKLLSSRWKLTTSNEPIFHPQICEGRENFDIKRYFFENKVWIFFLRQKQIKSLFVMENKGLILSPSLCPIFCGGWKRLIFQVHSLHNLIRHFCGETNLSFHVFRLFSVFVKVSRL